MTRALAILAVLAASGCGVTVDIYTYQSRPLPAQVNPAQALRTALVDLDSVTPGYLGQSRIDRVVLDRHPGAMELYATTPSGHQFSLCYQYTEIPADVHAVTADRGRYTVWVKNGPRADLGLHFKNGTSARLFLDAANALHKG